MQEQPTQPQYEPQPQPIPTPAPEPHDWEPPRGPIDEAVPLPEPVFTPFSLTVGDGFKFGCGFTMALAIAALILMLMLSFFFLAASLLGIPVPGSR